MAKEDSAEIMLANNYSMIKEPRDNSKLFSSSSSDQPLFIAYRKHIIECENMIADYAVAQKYNKYGFSSFEHKCTANAALIERLIAEKKEDPNLVAHLSFDTAIKSLKEIAGYLQICLLHEKIKLDQPVSTYSSPRI